MKEFTVKKPRAVVGYPIHRAVAALAKGAPHHWRDNGDTVTIRTTAPLEPDGAALPEVKPGELRLFNLRACVNRKVKGKHIYPARGDTKTRHDWLARQGQRHGFEVVTVHCSSNVATIADQAGRRFTLDATDFTGVLKVIDIVAFDKALCDGVGSTGRAFGFSLLAI